MSPLQIHSNTLSKPQDSNKPPPEANIFLVSHLHLCIFTTLLRGALCHCSGEIFHSSAPGIQGLSAAYLQLSSLRSSSVTFPKETCFGGCFPHVTSSLLVTSGSSGQTMPKCLTHATSTLTTSHFPWFFLGFFWFFMFFPGFFPGFS